MDYQKREPVSVGFFKLWQENVRYLRKKVFKPYGKMLCMRAIRFYQKHLSKKRCPYNPSCSEYTMRCINNQGVITGILLGVWRILRCNPFTKGGYDPEPERFFQKKWLL